MLAVWIENGKVDLARPRRPRRKPGYALIRPSLAGICNTDLELLRGYYGFRGVPGHEFAGMVVEADTPGLVGRRVVGEINLGCGACDWCRRGMERHCPRRTVLGIVKHPGAFAEFLTLPEKNLHVLPASIPDQEAVFTEPLAAACEILEQVKIPKGAEVAVLGDGKLGLLIGQVLQAHGAHVQQFGRHEEKLRLARGWGIAAARMPARPPAAAFHWVVEATGSSAGLAAAVRMTRPRGTVVMKSTVHGTVPLDTAPVIVHEVTLVGSRCGRFADALRLLKSGKVSVRGMISDCYALPEAAKAFDYANRKGVLKVLLAM